MSILRVYDPPECDAAGVPLDWERCRACDGSCRVVNDPRDDVVPEHDVRPCPGCGGHGSLKAAAAHGRRLWWKAEAPHDLPIRCEGCGHPMSDGTWEGPVPGEPNGNPDHGPSTNPTYDMQTHWAWDALKRGEEPTKALAYPGAHHYSPCDERCEHGGPHRWAPGVEGKDLAKYSEGWPRDFGGPIEASWRPVDVRTLGWPHDLRPEKLAVLCLRCLAAR